MKKIIVVIITILTFTVILTAADMKLFDVSKQSETAAFNIGTDDVVGGLWYIIDRKNKLCFATINNGDFPINKKKGQPLIQINCNQLKGIKPIKTYLETGKTP